LTPQASPKPALTVWFRLLRGQAAARRTLEAGLQAAHGLTVVGYEALLLLSEAEGGALRRIDLSRSLGLTASGVTRLLDGLERESLVAKQTCAEDARVTYATLTEAGSERLARASCSHVGSVRALFEERYSDEELETLASLLGRLPQ
jgi:DNA-binding MarR family transcriptional regulator